MASTPDEFLAQAIKLFRSASSDPDYRSVVIAAYYGAYHSVVHFEERLPCRSQANVEKTGSHEALLLRLERPHPDLDYYLKTVSKELAGMMRQIKPLRELASYDTKSDMRVDQAESVIQMSKDIMAECKKAIQKIS